MLCTRRQMMTERVMHMLYIIVSGSDGGYTIGIQRITKSQCHPEK